ncbi:hypothetical protein FACS1894201_05460 [Bacteroidia bacterium]|nr:hypothetical protein FACS1894201_05460 [Bacteroidia bacterium]
MKKYNLCLILLISLFNATSQDVGQFFKKPRLTHHGNIALHNSLGFGSQYSAAPWNWVLTANYSLGIWGMQFPFSFGVSNMQTSYTHPFNHWQFEPEYKGFRLRLGASFLNFSPYTLAGVRFDGVAIEANPQKSGWNGAVLYGRIQNPETDDPARDNSTNRIGYGLLIGKKTKSNNLTISAFRAFDNYTLLDEGDIHPKENMSLSVSGQTNFFKNIYIKGEWGNSAYTENTLSSKQESPVKLYNPAQFLVTNRLSTSVAHAYKIEVGHRLLQLGYEYVDPYYKTLGSYYMVNDFRNLTVNAGHQFKKMSISGRFGIQQEGLAKESAHHSQRLVYSLQAHYQINSKINLSGNYSNFQTYAYIRNVVQLSETTSLSDFIDSLSCVQISQNANVNATYNFLQKGNYRHSLSFFAGMQQTDAQALYMNHSLGYVCSEKSGKQFGVNILTTIIEQSHSFGCNVYYGDNFAEKKGRWRVTLLNNCYFADKHLTKNVWSLKGSCSYDIKTKHIFQTNLALIRNNGISSLVTIGYNYTL